jgi:predicted permease
MQDFLYALRFLGKRWGIASVAVLVMALGISLTTTMYAIIEGVVLRGPDYEDVREILFLQTTIPQSQFNQSVRIHDYLDWKEQQSVFDEMAAYFGTSVNLSGDGTRAETFRGARLSASTFPLLGERPFMGRVFTEAEDLQTNLDIVVLGYHVWVNRFNRDPDIIGRSIRVSARPMTVIGIMPEGFRFPELHDMWLPLNIDPGVVERREGPGMSVIGRLADGVTEEEARTQLTSIAARLTQQYPEANREIVPVVRSWMEVQLVDAETRGLLYTMFVAVVGVLLIACANVANLLFAVTIARGKELAVRTAMGASRTRVLRQLLMESLVLAAGGGILGVVLSKFSLDVFTRIVMPLNPPPYVVFELSSTVIAFVIGITFLAALASGILPAIHATKTDVHSLLQDQSRGSSSRSVSRWSTGLVALEVALSCALLVGAGLMVRSTLAVGQDDFGLNREGLLTARLVLPGITYSDTLANAQVIDRMLVDLAAVPGVSEVAVTSNLPVLGTSLNFYGVRDRQYADDGEYSFGGFTRVSPGFFDIIGVSVSGGRGFDNTDVMGDQRVMIVDRRFAELNWPGEDPVGKQVRLGRSDSENPWHTVVGLVETFEMLRPLQFGANPPEGMFVPIRQRPVRGLSIMVRTAGDPLTLATPVRDVMARIDSDIPVNQLNSLDARVAEASLDTFIIGGMFMVFGVVALILASIGLYAVMAFSVIRRTTEVGIRMALGANQRRIIRLILAQGGRPVGVGLVVGLLLALGLGKALSTFLYDVSALDPVTFVGIPSLLVVVSLLALMLPATRASRIAPGTALREE